MSSDHSNKRPAIPSVRILERVREDATDLALLATVATHDWKLLSDRNATQLHEMTGESLSSKVSTIRTFGKGGGGHPSEFYLIRATTTVRADVNTMLDLLRTSTSDDFRVVMKKMFDRQFESGAIVDSLSCTTPPPWASSRARSSETSTGDGIKPYWSAHLLQYEFQGHPKSSKTDRLHFRNSGVIVEELVEEDSNGPVVRVSLLLSLMPSKLVLKEVSQSPRMRVALAAGHEVAKKYRRWLQTLALGVSHFAEAAKPAVTMQHLSKMTWTESDHCFLCLKTFRTYRRRHHCRFCGEAVYGSCSGCVNMASFDINYEGSGGNSDSIIAGHRKLDLRMASDGSGRNLGENASPNASRADMEELTESRGCNTNNTIHGPPPPYLGRDSGFEGGQVLPMRAREYQQYQQNSGQKMSFSTISSSSFSVHGQTACQFELCEHKPHATQLLGGLLTECFFGSRPGHPVTQRTDIIPGSSVASSMIPVMGDEENVDFSCKDNRSSYATTAATNEGSNHSQFNYSNMTPLEVKATNRLVREASARGNLRMNNQQPLPHQPQDYEQSPVELANKKIYHVPRTAQGGLSPCHSQKSSYSSGSAHSDLIHLNSVTNATSEPTKVDFVVFNTNHQTEVIKNAESSNDMIPLHF
ncbi:Zinc finger, FYVE-related [Phytophthora cactorum]|nr:Zinc finger, FYVE-related [Phytophthora cactorum]